MKNPPLLLIGLALLFAGCTDLSKVDRDEKKDPLEPVTPEEVIPETVVVSSPETVSYPFERMIKDLSGRSIEANVIAKLDSQVGFEKVSGNQKFILPLDRLSEDDQAYFKGIHDGGDFQAVSEAISKTARLGDREASWHRDIVGAEREAKKLDLPKLTLFLIVGDSLSKTLENDLLFSRPFRKWAGQNLVLCALPVEPPGSKMAITSAMAENRRVAELYGVTDRVTLALDVPGKEDSYRISLEGVPSVDDVIREVEKVLKKKKR